MKLLTLTSGGHESAVELRELLFHFVQAIVVVDVDRSDKPAECALGRVALLPQPNEAWNVHGPFDAVLADALLQLAGKGGSDSLAARVAGPVALGVAGPVALGVVGRGALRGRRGGVNQTFVDRK